MRYTCDVTPRRLARPGPVVQGASQGRTAEIRGQTFTDLYAERQRLADRLVEMKVNRPFPMLGRYGLDDSPDGTLVAIHASGAPGRFFRWATPVMSAQVRKSITGDLNRLRVCLES